MGIHRFDPTFRIQPWRITEHWVRLPSKRHIQFRGPDGRLYAEEVFGTEGFVGPTSTMYHIHAPTQVMGWETLYSTKPEYVEMDTMRMRHVKSMPLPPKGIPSQAAWCSLGTPIAK